MKNKLKTVMPGGENSFDRISIEVIGYFVKNTPIPV